MDNQEAVYKLYRDKALDIIKAADSYMVFFIVSFVSVFIPLAYSSSKNSSEMMEMLTSFIIFIPLLSIPPCIFLIAKYKEYKFHYSNILIKSIIDKNLSTSEANPNYPDYDTICKSIVYSTNFKYKYVMTLLLNIFEPEIFKEKEYILNKFEKASTFIMFGYAITSIIDILLTYYLLISDFKEFVYLNPIIAIFQQKFGIIIGLTILTLLTMTLFVSFNNLVLIYFRKNNVHRGLRYYLELIIMGILIILFFGALVGSFHDVWNNAQFIISISTQI